MISGYEDGFDCIGSLVDVGGGIGTLVTEIVKAYSHIKGINFDLPHVVATAPKYDGVTHMGGDMFKAIPNADAVFMKVNSICCYQFLLFFFSNLYIKSRKTRIHTRCTCS